MAVIELVPLAGSRDSDLGRLSELLRDLFHRDVMVAAPLADLEFAFDAGRDQYASRAVLADLLGRRCSHVERILGVTGCDLFIPILTFVFGEAQLNGHAAVVSSCRLRNGFYGMRDDPEVTQVRLEKEAVHELGHTYGLLHCPDGLCVMRRSTYVEELDQKDVGFCDVCARRLSAPA